MGLGEVVESYDEGDLACNILVSTHDSDFGMT